ncbi:3'-5' exonuclease [Variovorax sp. J22G21]|uniref:3'-5' exonuclease n=1 Tax=Variovorax fucosicus TaxID=3053517 RepID=UPI0025787638|nr:MULTISPECIES: 3'-5' exonuclease [unclassified Variovorax]MDM0038786.1 3'-5' exonuclease [Variovorax sp. J22R193]MDM0063562.1 3'-5' exonuclease [Variovorax sp. J22G21]
MKALMEVTPTPEQLALFSRVRPGVEVIRGAAGSGKTTTAVLKLRQAVAFFLSRMKRQHDKTQLRVLILTFNRTLRGYVAELAAKQFEQGSTISLEISTFSKWAMGLLGSVNLLDEKVAHRKLRQLGAGLPFSDAFIIDEVEYVLGKFLPDDLGAYLTVRRDGRGNTPRMEKAARELLMATVILPYLEYKLEAEKLDWSDLAVRVATANLASYDVVVVDETQDFSANQVRAVMAQMASEHTATFVLDSAQRIYARSFTWQEVGVTVRPENSFRLSTNYRNSKEIAQFAASILEGIPIDDDGSMPDFKSAARSGTLPVVLEGKYSGQLRFALNFIKDEVDLNLESVAFLHPKGYGWFDGEGGLRATLAREKLPYVEIARNNEWPQGSENIALSTLHSAKGLEFDHVFILGLNAEVLSIEEVGATNEEEKLVTLRRLLAMGVGRARKTVVIGYKPEDKPELADFFAAGKYEKKTV